MNPDEIRRRLARALELLGHLCTREERWTMSVPVDMQRDSDMVLGAALADIPALLDVLAVRDHQIAALEQDAEGRYHEIADLRAELAVRDQQLEDAKKLLSAPCSDDLAAMQGWFDRARAWLAGLDVQEAGQ